MAEDPGRVSRGGARLLRSRPDLHAAAPDDQVLGSAALPALGRELWGERDPAESFRSDPPYRYAKKNGKYVLTLDLPFVDRNEVDLAMASGDLIVRIGNVRHHIPVPRMLTGFSPSGAKVEDGKLTVRFTRPEAR